MKVLICGAGIAGLSTALALVSSGHEVEIVERAPRLRGEGYMIDFFGSGYDACEAMDLLRDLARIHYPIDALAFVDDDGRERLSVPYAALRRRLLRGRHFNFLRGDLERVLYERVTRSIDVRFATTIGVLTELEGHVQVELSDGSTSEYDLVVGTDGVHSTVRRLVFGPDREYSRFVGCNVVAFVLPAAPRDWPYPKSLVTLTSLGRQVSVYPLGKGRLATMFIHRSEERAADTSREAALRELRTRYDGMRWIVPQLLRHADLAESLYFDAVEQIELPRWSIGRVVLVGDACQCVSLLAGQGASMAVAGGYLLARELSASPLDVGRALTRYEARLKPAIRRKQRAGRRIAAWFVPESPWRLTLRDLGLRMSTWPVASALIRRRLAAESVLRG